VDAVLFAVVEGERRFRVHVDCTVSGEMSPREAAWSCYPKDIALEDLLLHRPAIVDHPHEPLLAVGEPNSPVQPHYFRIRQDGRVEVGGELVSHGDLAEFGREYAICFWTRLQECAAKRVKEIVPQPPKTRNVN